MIKETGKTVEHAHLHLCPYLTLGSSLPKQFTTHPDVKQAGGWDDVPERFAQQGHYYYLKVDGRRFVESYHSGVFDIIREVIAAALGGEMMRKCPPPAAAGTEPDRLRAPFQECET